MTTPEEFSVQAGPITAQVTKAGRGEPLVYLHGAFGYSGWPAFLSQLAKSYTVYAPVHPGFDESEGFDQIEDLLDLTLYHFDLLDALGLQAPHVVGHFFGAMIAAEMASVRPDGVGKLVLASPAGLWVDHDPGVDYFATPADELRALLFRDPESAIAQQTMPDPKSDEEHGLQGIERARSLSAVAKFLWPIPDKGLRKRLHRVKSETLIVVADNDRIVPPTHGTQFERLLPGSRLHIVEGAGHLFILERPDEFAGLVAGFLGG
jgi:pimeloyl-ACP methyl ester carboxylesterase